MSRQPRKRSPSRETTQGGSRDIAERKRAEAALRRSEDLLSFSLTTARIGCWELDLMDHTAHRSLQHDQIFGYQELLPEWTYDMFIAHVIPEDREAVDGKFRQALATQCDWSFECRILRHDGATRWIWAAGRHRADESGQIRRMAGIVQDITERKQAEAALREAHGRTTAILASIADAFYSLDAEWRFVEVNPAAERAPFGRPASELIGKVIWDMFPKIVGTRVHRHYLDAVGKRSHEHYESPSPLNGRWYEVFMFPRPGGLDVYLRDIDDRKKAEQALRESEERLKLAQLIAHLGSWELDIVANRLSWSDEVYRIFGFGPQEFGATYQAFLETVHPEDRAAVDSTYSASLREGRDSFEIEHRIIRKSIGEIRTVHEKCQHVRDQSGSVARSLGMVQDITERKQAEEALRAANLQLAEADQRKNEFLAVLSHELRNPLSPIRNSLYILDRTAPGGEQAKHALAVIGRQVGQLARLVDDLLDVTRVSRNKIQLQRSTLELNDLVRRTVEDHHSLFEEKGIVVEATFAPDRLPVKGDVNRLAQIVGNLLQNAAKFTPAGGRVRVSTAVAASRQRATLRVTDTGVGIEPAMLSRLFQPFMQADATLDRSKGGLGLGLALVKGLVEMHGGEVCAHSDGPGKGAEFMVELPLDETAVAEASSRAVGTAGRHRRVLIIEDNRDAADSLREVLQFGGHIVEVAYNGPDGLHRARDFKPEIVLCDIGLPGMDGYEVARAFRADEALKGVFLVALSGYALPDDLQRAGEAGFERHLAKPSSLEKLEELLADVPS
jgi:PAS domain S-box-containing protein